MGETSESPGRRQPGRTDIAATDPTGAGHPGRRLFELFVDGADDEIAIYDRELRLQYTNTAIERNYGISRADCLGKTHGDLGVPSDASVRALIEASVHLAFQSGSPGTIEFQHDRNGRRMAFQSRLTPDFEEAGSVRSVFCITRDVTPQTDAKDQALESERAFSTTLRSIGDAVIAADVDRRIMFMNRVAEELTGWTEAEAIGIECAEVFHIVNQQTRLPAHNPIDTVIETGVTVGLANHTALVRKDGSEIPIADSGAPIRDGDGRLLGVVLVFRDITAQHRAEQLLTNSEAKYHLLTDSMPQIVWTCRPDGTCDYFNEHLGRYCGREVESCLEWGWLELLPAVDRAGIRAEWEERVCGEAPIEFEIQIRRFDGEHRWHLLRGIVVRDSAGQIEQWIGTATDIHDRRMADEERARTAIAQRYLADSSALLSSTLDYEITLTNVAQLAVPHLADWCTVHILQDDGIVRSLATAHVNKEKLKTAAISSDKFPYNPDDAGGVPKVIRTGTSEFYPFILDTLIAAVAHDPEREQIIRQLGFRSVMIVPMRARDRTFGAISFIISESERRYTPHDLTVAEDLGYRAALALDNASLFRAAQNEVEERRRAEEALLAKTAQVEILNARLQRAMSETHHRVKNNLQVISALVDMQMVEYSVAVPAVEMLRISQHTRSLASLHDLLTRQARTDEVEFVSAAAMVRQLMPILQGMLNGRKIKTHIDDVLLPVQQTTAIAIIINEAITNAAKHADSGDIEVRLIQAGTRLKLTVTDRGPGFPAALDPDNLTSTGLDLVRTLAGADLMGSLRLENAEHGGARLAVEFAASTGRSIHAV